MRILIKAVTSTVTVGLLAFGAVAGGGGSALAGQAPVSYVPITGCITSVTDVTVGFLPNCTALSGTMDHPNTSIVVGFDEVTDVLGKLIEDQDGQGFTEQWVLACDVNGATVTAPGSYTVTSTEQPPFTVIDLQSAVGSPDPNRCSVEGLTVHTLLPLVTADIYEALPFQIGAVAVATTAAPGAIRQEEGTTSGGAHAALCADDTANGNAGAKIQGFECLSDLAQDFVQTSAGQLVNNGDCVTATKGGTVVLDKCVADDTSQQWTQATPGGTLKNTSTGTCLTAPSVKNGTPLTVAACGGAVRQQWELPKLTPAPVSPRAALGAALDRK